MLKTLCLMVKYANLMKAELSWLGFEEMEYQDGQRHFEPSTGWGKQKKEKRQIMMKIRKLLRDK
ncbi:hypothetical protein M513_07725 [Trichuris suis]|uniref:Uncharacterized protein n=1 Tax=Trichuris suis TaxID=68888 RepID=A0A085M274_9BILA|nr:hypothetical protein M513_07725 [Trichuris suis]